MILQQLGLRRQERIISGYRKNKSKAKTILHTNALRFNLRNLMVQVTFKKYPPISLYHSLMVGKNSSFLSKWVLYLI